jgi:hypothetical protein
MDRLRIGTIAAGLALLASAQITCGSGAPPHCDQVEPCGGDVVGTWKLAGGCENTAVLMKDLSTACPGAAIDSFGISVTGTLAFNSDMTFTGTGVTATVHALETVPLSCTNAATCAAVTSPNNATTVSCSGASTCTCTVTNTVSGTGGVLGGNTSGTYSISANTLTLQAAATSNSNNYCVQGTELHFMTVDTTMNMGPMGQATITSDLVALKQ